MFKNFTNQERKLSNCLMVNQFIEKAKYESLYGKGLKIFTSKQMLERLPIPLAQVKASNNSENLLNKIKKNVYSLYQSKEITKNIYNNIVTTIFMNSENSKTYRSHV